MNAHAQTGSPRFLNPSLVVFAVALAMRLLVLLSYRDAPTMQNLVLDARDYDSRAVALAQGRVTPELFWQPVLYPAWLAALYLILGHSVMAARVAQAVIGSLTCALTCRLGRRMGGPRTGWLAGLITAFYGPLIFYEIDLVGDGLAAIWSVVLLGWWRRVHETPRPRMLLGLGLWGALSILSRPTYAPFVAVLAGGLLWQAWRGGAGWSRLGWMVLGLALGLAPAGFLSARVSDKWVPLPSSGGLNLYIGNNPDPCATVNIRPGYAWDMLAGEPMRAGLFSVRERERYFSRRALEFIRRQPVAFAGGLARKTWQLACSRELPRNENPYLARDFSRLLQVLFWKAGPFGFPWGVLLPLALWGGWRARRKVPRMLPAFLALYAAAIVLVFVSGRYRLPLVPPLAILAALGVEDLAGLVRARAWRQAGLAALALAGTATAISLPRAYCEERVRYDVELRRLVGCARLRAGFIEDAKRCLEDALRREPDDYESRQNLAAILSRKGRNPEALAEVERALRTRADYADGHNSAGIILSQLGREAEALGHFQEARRIKPEDGRLRHGLALALLHAGRTNEAMQELQQAVRLDDRLAESHFQLGLLLAQQGRLDEAAACFQNALRAQSDHGGARRALGLALQGAGRFDEALAHYARAVIAAPDDPWCLNGMAWILAAHPDARLRDPPRAAALAERACRLTHSQQPQMLDTLAAAYAAQGRFLEARHLAGEALRMARRSEPQLAGEITARLTLYQQGRPYCFTLPRPR